MFSLAVVHNEQVLEENNVNATFLVAMLLRNKKKKEAIVIKK
jgi:hypothetical protein